jgi:hypothetical protein
MVKYDRINLWPTWIVLHCLASNYYICSWGNIHVLTMEDIELCFLFQYLYVTVETKWEDGSGEASGQELNLEEPFDQKN